MQRYFLELSYRGTGYSGWQVQASGMTVQKAVDEGLSVLLREKVHTMGAGRTDAGVHASYFVAHFDSERNDLHEDEGLLYHLNSVLPGSISVHKITPVKSAAHARFSALSRTYEYLICRRKDPFRQDLCYQFAGRLNLVLMQEACKILPQYHNFRSFSKLHSGNRTTLCTIREAVWEENDKMLVFRITADRFLRNMVRAIVGTMLDLGREKMSLEEFEEIIRAGDRKYAGTSAPARGLYLVNISYPRDIFLLSF